MTLNDPVPNSQKLVVVFGGSGFVGRHVVRALARQGYRVRAAVRRPDLAGHLQPLGTVGQVMAVQANLRDAASVARAIAGASHVVNLVGILFEGGKQSFEAIQSRGPGLIAKACADAGAQRLVHVSAIGADATSPALYAQSKAAGEAAVLAAMPDAIILRPSIVFGPEDNFFNQFAALARILPVLPLIGGGQTKFQPVYVGDVAQAVVAGIEGRATALGRSGTRVYELGGPRVMTFEDVLRYILEVTQRRRLLVKIPFALARFQASFMQVLPKPMLTVDQVTMLESDNIVSAEAATSRHTLEGLGIEPTPVEAIVPGYLWRFRKGGQFEAIKPA